MLTDNENVLVNDGQRLVLRVSTARTTTRKWITLSASKEREERRRGKIRLLGILTWEHHVIKAPWSYESNRQVARGGKSEMYEKFVKKNGETERRET